MLGQVTATTLDIPEPAIVDLRERLARTRFPDQAPGPAWAYGADLDYIRDLVEYWRTRFDWRAQEARLNAFPQYRAALSRHRPAFFACAGSRAFAVPVAAAARLARIGVRIPGDHPPFDRSGAVWRRPGRCLHGRRALAAGLRPVVQTGPAPVRRRGDRGLCRGADAKHARLFEIRCSRRRLGWHHSLAPRLRAFRQAHRDSCQFAVGPARSGAADGADAGRAALFRPTGSLAEGRDRISINPGDQATDPRFCPDGFTGRVGGLDCREIPELVRLRRRH